VWTRNGETAEQCPFLKPVLPECNVTQATKKWSFAQMRSNIGDAVPVVRARKIGHAP
jgi:hypothetical protein